MRSQEPKFYYEFKKKRTLLLKEKEPQKKELYHVTYLRNIEREKAEKERKKREMEEYKQKIELEEFKNKKGSNVTTVTDSNTINLEVENNQLKGDMMHTDSIHTDDEKIP